MVRITQIQPLLSLQKPLLLLGAPGIGKTAILAQYAIADAKNHEKIFVDPKGEASVYAGPLGPRYVRPRGHRDLLRIYEEVSREPEKYYVFLRIPGAQITAEDLQYPRLVSNAVVNIPPVMLALLTIDDVSGMLFIDEITNIKDDNVRTMLFSMIQEKTVGLAGVLSSDIKIVAAGNREEHSIVAEPLPAPLLNRFIIINVEPPTVEEFAEYLAMYAKNYNPAVPAYLLSRPENLLVTAEAEGYENFPSPRTWEAVATIPAPPALPEEIYNTAIVGLLGRRVGTEFLAYMKLEPLRPEDVLAKPERLREVESNYERLTFTVSLASLYVADSKSIEKLADSYTKFIEKLLGISRELTLFSARIVLSRKQKNVRDFIILAKKLGELGILEKLRGLKEKYNEIVSEMFPSS